MRYTRTMQIRFISTPHSGSTSFFSKAVALLFLAIFAAVALMFSAIVLVVILVVAIVGGAYLWWKTRALRKHLQAQMQQFTEAQNAAMKHEPFSGEIIEGEVVEVSESRIMNGPSSGK